MMSECNYAFHCLFDLITNLIKNLSKFTICKTKVYKSCCILNEVTEIMDQYLMYGI